MAYIDFSFSSDERIKGGKMSMPTIDAPAKKTLNNSDIIMALAKARLGRGNCTLITDLDTSVTDVLVNVLEKNGLSTFYLPTANSKLIEHSPSYGTQKVVFIVGSLDKMDNMMDSANIIHAALSYLTPYGIIVITSRTMSKKTLTDLALYAGVSEFLNKEIKDIDCSYVVAR